MKMNHIREIPEHPVIWAMERYGEYPPPAGGEESVKRGKGKVESEKWKGEVSLRDG